MGLVSASLLSFFQTQEKIQENSATNNILNSLNRLLNQYYATHLRYPTESELISQIKLLYTNLETLKEQTNPKCRFNANSITTQEDLTAILQLGWGVRTISNENNTVIELVALQSDCITPIF